MKCVRLLLLTLLLVGRVHGAESGADEVHLQLSLFPPLQMHASDTSVAGLRLGLISKNEDVRGLDLGVLNWTSGDELGLQWGVINKTSGKFTGAQFGVVSLVSRRFLGWQASMVNIDSGEAIGFINGAVNTALDGVTGYQLGLFNYANEVTGLQVGVLNIAGSMTGIQIGLINVIQDHENLPVLPIINASF